jgi:hypothetical protein
LGQIERQPAIQSSEQSASLCRGVQGILQSAEFQTLLVNWSIYAERQAGVDKGSAFRLSPNCTLGKLDSFVYYAPAVADTMFPRGSMPWTLLRETCFWRFSNGTAGESPEVFRKMAGRELHRLQGTDHSGPVSHLLLAKALRKVFPDSPQFAAQIAGQGFTELSDEDFLKDAKLLTHGDHGIAVACRAVVGHLSKQSATDQQQILELLPENWRAPLAQIMLRLNEPTNEPVDEAIAHVLLETWHNGLRESVAAELRSMSTEVAQAQIPDDPGAATAK